MKTNSRSSKSTQKQLTQPLKALYSLADLASLTGLCPKTVSKMLKDNGIEPIKIKGNYHYYALSEIALKLHPFYDSLELMLMKYGMNNDEIS